MALSRPIQWLSSPLLVSLLGGCVDLRGGYTDLHGALFGPDTDTFCTVENGYQQGLAGARYTDDMCPDRLAPGFLDGYQRGYALHLTEREIDSMERAIEALSGDLSRTWSQLDRARAEWPAQSSAGENPSAVRARIARLTDKAHTLSARLDEMEADLQSRKRQLLQARHMFAASEP